MELVLPPIEFVYNSSLNRSTKKTSFKMVCGLQLNHILDLVPLKISSIFNVRDFYLYLYQDDEDESILAVDEALSLSENSIRESIYSCIQEPLLHVEILTPNFLFIRMVNQVL